MKISLSLSLAWALAIGSSFALLCSGGTAGAADAARPNIVLILADDMGFSDLGCYGGEINTPTLDHLAADGIRFTQFYNCARCCPSRAALLTGLYPHQAGVGDMVDEYARAVREKLHSPAYADHLNPQTPTIAEVLRGAGYHTYMAGKWHLGYREEERPVHRGFERSFAVIEGAMNYYGFGIQHTGLITNPPMVLDDQVYLPPREGFYATTAFTDKAVQYIHEHTGGPFFLYLAYTAPHWPLHAPAEVVQKYRGKFKAGWDQLRAARLAWLQQHDLIATNCTLAPRPQAVRAWDTLSPQEQEAFDERFAVYAAQVEMMDRGVARVMSELKAKHLEQNTVVLFLSDNGGAGENPNRSLPGAVLGTRESFEGYALRWAHVSSAPFERTKCFAHEGGIAAPCIAYWPAGIPAELRGKLNRSVAHIIDLLPTCAELAQAPFPATLAGKKTTAPEGLSLVPTFLGQERTRPGMLFWEHEGGRAVRAGDWKLVAEHGEPWELYNLGTDRTEQHDLMSTCPEKAKELTAAWEAWAARVDALPWPLPAKARSPEPQSGKSK
jgi:arylsulfatase A-like enzyme